MPDNLHVLYVDDEPDLLEISKLFLEKAGFNVDTLTSVDKALTQIQTTHYDAIISDYQMPGKDGIAFLKALRSLGNTIPFILFTGRGREEIVIQALNEGADFYLQKGGDPKSQFAELAHKIIQSVQKRRAEQALSDRESQLHTLINAMPDIVCFKDGKGRWLEANTYDLDLFQLTGVDYVNKTDCDLADYSPFYRDAFLTCEDSDEIAWSKKAVSRGEETIPRPDGTRKVFDIIKVPVFNPDGSRHGLVVVGRDITERKRATDDLLFKNLVLSTQQEMSPDGILIVDERGKILSINRKFIDIWGISPDLFTQGSDEPLLKDVVSKVLDPDRFLSRVRYLYEHPDEKSFEEILLRDGRVLERFSSPMRGEDDRYYGRVWFFRDVTERRMSAEALEESEKLYRSVIENIQDIFYRTDKGGKLIMASPSGATLLGYDSLDEILGKPIAETLYFDPEDRKVFLDELKKSGIVSNFTTRLKKKDGTALHVSTNSQYYYDETGAVAGVEGIIRDISEYKRAEIKVTQKTKTLSILNEIISIANRAENLHSLLQVVLKATLDLMEYDAGGIYLTDHLAGTSTVTVSENLPPDFLEQIRNVSITQPPYDKLLVEGVPTFTEHYEKLSLDRSRQTGFLSLASVPLLSKSKIVGALNVISNQRHVVTEEERETLASIGKELGTSIDRLASEDSVKQSAANLEILFNTIDDMVLLLDMEGKIIRTNDAVKKNLGYSDEELIGNSILILHVPDQQEKAVQYIQGMIAGTINTWKGSFLARNGMHIEVETKITQGFWNNHRVLIGVSRDVTESRRTEKLQKEQEARLRVLLNAPQDSIVLLDRQGKIVSINDAGAKRLGGSVQEITGRCAYDMLPPEIAKKRKVFIDRVFESNRPDVLDDERAGMTIHNEIFPILDVDQGSVAYVAIFARDMTEYQRSQSALRESEERYRAIFTDSRDAIMILSPDLEILAANPAAVLLFGFENEKDLIMQNPVLMSPLYQPDGPLSVDKFHEIVGLCMEKGSHIFEWLLRRSDTSEFTASVLLSRFESGNRSLMQATVRDITVQKKAEEALWESEARLQSILRGSPVLQFVIDRDHQVISWNKAIEEYSGIRAEEIIGTDHHWKAFYPEKRPVLSDLLVDGNPEALDLWYAEKVKKSRYVEGAYEAVDYFPTMGTSGAWLSFTAAPVRDAAGTIIGAVETLEDTTDRKRAEAALRESERKYRSIIENMQDFVYQTDMDGKFTMVSPSGVRLLGFDSMDQLVGMHIRDIYANPDDRENLMAAMKEKGSVYAYPVMLRSHDNRLLHILTSSHFMYDDNGIVRGVEGILHDVTELRQIEETFREANKKLNLLSSITRHDMNNQLTALTGYLTITRELAQNSDIADYLDKSLRIADILERQIRFTRDYQDIGLNAPRWQNVSILTKNAISALPMRGIEVVIDRFDLEVLADPLLEKVFYNLIDNALRYGGEKMHLIQILSRETESGIVITVMDDGVGISAEDKQGLFEKGHGKNTGLGLFLSREILSLTRISIEETGIAGVGARFEITAPREIYHFVSP